MLAGFQRAGFIYIKNHGIDRSLIQKTFAESAGFFKRPLAQKEQLSWTIPEANRGYVRLGREKTSDLADEAAVGAQRELEGEDVSLKEVVNVADSSSSKNAWTSAGKVMDMTITGRMDLMQKEKSSSSICLASLILAKVCMCRSCELLL